MYFFEGGNFSNPNGSDFSGGVKRLGAVKIATVLKTGTISPNLKEQSQRKRDERFNADPYIIRCKIVGSNNDNVSTDDVLSNCFPLMPKHNAIIPKEGEIVLIFEFGSEGDKNPERFYVGPIISTLKNLNHQTLFSGAMGGLAISPTATVADLNKIPETKGVFSEYDSDYGYSIDGRDNADIVFKSSEIILRAGKFVRQNDNVTLNQTNPAFIQIKHGFYVSKKGSKSTSSAGCSAFGGCGGSTSTGGGRGNVSVNNIVADKINLLTYGDDARPNFNLTYRDNKNNKTPYIDDAELNNILEKAHPLVFGDKLLEYLVALEQAFLNHKHNHLGLAPPMADQPTTKFFSTEAPKLREEMLSKNIKIN